MRISKPKDFIRENLNQEEEESGAYIYLDRNGNEIYIGVASESLEERLNACYYGRSDYAQVERKKTLRRKVRKYRTVYTTEARARKLEHNKKDEMRFNQL